MRFFCAGRHTRKTRYSLTATIISSLKADFKIIFQNPEFRFSGGAACDILNRKMEKERKQKRLNIRKLLNTVQGGDTNG